MSGEYILTKKSYINDIVRTIKNKDSIVNTLKIKDMDDAIQNLDSKTLIPLILIGSLGNDLGGQLTVKGNLKVDITDEAHLTAPLQNARVNVYGNNGFWEDIGFKHTYSTGDFEIVAGNYDMYKLEYAGNSTFQKEETIIAQPTLKARVQADGMGLLEAHLVESNNLITLVNDIVVYNNKGYIQEHADPDDIVEVTYKGPIETVNPKGNYWYGVRSVHVPYSVSNLDYESVFRNKQYLEDVFLQDSHIIYMPRFDETNTNLKVIRLPESITSFPYKAASCNLDYINIPSKNNPLLNGVLSQSTVKCLELESGLDQELSSDALGLANREGIRDVHFIIPGKPIGKEVPNLSFDHVFLVSSYRDSRISFQPDTERILTASAEEIMYFNRINIPPVCTYMEEDVFRGGNVQNDVLLRFECLVPPQFGPENDPTRCFATSGAGSQPYKVLCPPEQYSEYDAFFSSYDSLFYMSNSSYEYPLSDDYGEFCIEVLSRKLKTDPELSHPLFMNSNRTAPYYLDDVLQTDEFVFNDPLDFDFSYYGYHSLTVAGGFRNILENAFLNNKDIVKVRFPESIDYIEPHAFTGCSNLRTLIFSGSNGPPTLPDIGDGISAFDGLHPDCKIFVYDVQEDSYRDMPEFNKYNIIPMKSYLE